MVEPASSTSAARGLWVGAPATRPPALPQAAGATNVQVRVEYPVQGYSVQGNLRNKHGQLSRTPAAWCLALGASCLAPGTCMVTAHYLTPGAWHLA